MNVKRPSPYTYWLFLTVLLLGGGGYLSKDLRGARHLSTAMGLQSDFWILAALCLTHLVTRQVGLACSAIAYRRYSGRHATSDLTGFAALGGLDLGMWCAAVGMFSAVAVFAAGVPPGVFGLFRPIVLIALSVLSAALLSTSTGHIVFRFFFNSRPRPTYAEVACQQVYAHGRQCWRNTCGTSRYCVWHRILDKLSQHWKGTAAYTGMGLAGSSVLSVVAVLKGYGPSNVPLCLAFVALAIGVGFTAFTEGMIAKSYPFSRFAGLAAIFAIGLLLQAAGGFAVLSLISQDRGSLTDLLTTAEVPQNHLALVSAAAISWAGVFAAAGTVRFLRYVVLYDPPFLAHAVFGPALAMAVKLSWAGFQTQPVEPQAAARAFWSPVIENANWGFAAAFLSAFVLSEVINLSMRRKRLTTPEVWKKTVWPSFPVCWGSPMLSMWLTRHLFVALDIEGVVPFVVCSVIGSVPLTILGTNLVIRQFTEASERRASIRESRFPGQVIVSPGVASTVRRRDIELAVRVHLQRLSTEGEPLSVFRRPGADLMVLTDRSTNTTSILLDSELS